MSGKNFDVTSQYGMDVFNDETMKKYLPADVYTKLTTTIKEGKELDPLIADAVAKGMKE